MLAPQKRRNRNYGYQYYHRSASRRHSDDTSPRIRYQPCVLLSGEVIPYSMLIVSEHRSIRSADAAVLDFRHFSFSFSFFFTSTCYEWSQRNWCCIFSRCLESGMYRQCDAKAMICDRYRTLRRNFVKSETILLKPKFEILKKKIRFKKIGRRKKIMHKVQK